MNELVLFKQSGDTWNYFVTLEDKGTSPVFNGSVIYCFANKVILGGNNHIGFNAKILPIAPDYVGSTDGDVWASQKNQVSYNGMDNPIITVSGRWISNLGSADTAGSEILTPYKIVVLASSGRQLYLNDEVLLRNLIVESGSTFHTTNGIPVLLKDYKMSADSNRKGEVAWQLTFQEDKL